MMIEHEDLSEGIRRVGISGRLDFHGVEKVIGQLPVLLAAAGSRALVDLTNATMICSMGIRALILNAKDMQQRGGRMALVVNDGTIVSATLKSVGIDSLLPVFTSASDAIKALRS